MSEFRDIVFYDVGDRRFSYRSGLYVYEEVFSHGALTAAGHNGAGFMLNVLDDLPTRFRKNDFAAPGSLDFCAGGVGTNGRWRFVSIEKKESVNEKGNRLLTGEVTLESEVCPLRAVVRTTLDGTEIISRETVVTNLGETTLPISGVTLVGGGLEITRSWRSYPAAAEASDVYSVGYPDNADWGHEGLFRWHPLPREGFFIPGRHLADRHRHPAFYLRNNLTGAIFACQLAWSGGYSFRFRLDADGEDSRLSWQVCLDGAEPFVALGPGESYTLPAVHFGQINGGLDDAVNTMHDHLRRSVFTLPDARGLFGLVEGGMGPERVMDATAARHFIDTLALVGAETFIIDAGWYCPAGKEVYEWHKRMGDWRPDPGKYPDGLAEIRDYAHSKGLLFGMWADIESAGEYSDLRKTHPDWMLKNRFEEDTGILDLTNPEVAAWVEEELYRLITEYKADLFRLDNNISYYDLVGFASSSDAPQGVYGRYFAAAYAMYERLRRRLPDVVFENCAGGGGRTDVGMVSKFTHTWVSDWQKAPRSVAITNGMTMFLPPEVVDRLFSGMESHVQGSLPLIVRHTLFGRPTVNDFNPVSTPMNPEQISFVKRTLDLYKSFIRPFAKTGRIYHHTPEIYGDSPSGVCVMERGSRERDRSVIGVFSLGSAPEGGSVTVYPRGVSPEGRYEVYSDNSLSTAVTDGLRLVNDGLRVRLDGALSSELITLKRID